MPLKMIQTSTAPKAVGPYSQAIESSPMLFVSMQIGLEPETGEMATGGLEEQTKRALKNLINILEAGGSSKAHLLKVTVYLTDLAQFETINSIYAEMIGAHRPARSTMQVSALPKGALVAFDAVAEVSKPAI